MLQAVARSSEELGGFQCSGWSRLELEMAEKKKNCAYYCVSRLAVRLWPPPTGFRCLRLSRDRANKGWCKGRRGGLRIRQRQESGPFRQTTRKCCHFQKEKELVEEHGILRPGASVSWESAATQLDIETFNFVTMGFH
jgi:hypothetical protein